MPVALLFALFAARHLNAPPLESSAPTEAWQQLSASGRALLVDSPDARVASPLRLTPGQPPILSFRFYEGKQRHRFGDVDIMLDDAGH